jgi:uncharacterized membrane protein YfcA
MAESKDLLFKGIRYAVGAIPIMFIGPSVIHNAFLNKHTNWHYLVLFVGILLCILAVYLLHKGIQTMLKSLFDDQQN